MAKRAVSKSAVTPKLSEVLATSQQKRVDTGEAPHLSVKALAGTGKTFSLVVGVANLFKDERVAGGTLWSLVKGALRFEPIPSPQQKAVWDGMAQERPKSIVYAAFNKSIVEEFSTKWNWLVAALQTVGVSFSFTTVHSLGYSTCAINGRKPKVNKWKNRDLMEKLWKCDIREMTKQESGRAIVEGCEKLVRLVKLTTASTDANPEVLDELATHYGIELNGAREKVFAAVPQIVELARQPESIKEFGVDFEDMIWLPIVNGHTIPRCDMLLGDEAQDWNRCQQELLLKAGKRIVLCGDSNQAIYGFAGADVDSIPRLTARLQESTRGVVELPLTVTRRCGKAIVQEAVKIVPGFEAHEGNREGSIRYLSDKLVQEELVASAKGRDLPMVLCRVNAPMVGLAFKLLRENVKVTIQGRDFAGGLKGLIRKSKCSEVGEFLNWLDRYEGEEMARLAKRKRSSEEEQIALQDKCECLRAFCDGALTLKDVTGNIDKLFDDDSKGGILLSSVHRAKGLEAKRVYILKPELMPHPMAKSAWQQGQEMNLRYVAITRAIDELVYVQSSPKSVDDSEE